MIRVRTCAPACVRVRPGHARWSGADASAAEAEAVDVVLDFSGDGTGQPSGDPARYALGRALPGPTRVRSRRAPSDSSPARRGRVPHKMARGGVYVSMSGQLVKNVDKSGWASCVCAWAPDLMSRVRVIQAVRDRAGVHHAAWSDAASHRQPRRVVPLGLRARDAKQHARAGGRGGAVPPAADGGHGASA